MFKIAMRLKINKILIGIVLLFLVNISNLLAADEFPMFKSDVARSAVNPSAALVAPFTISWTSTNNLGSTNAVAYSSPVVFGGQAYIGAVDGTLFAFTSNPASSTNSPLWQYKTGAGIYGSPAVAAVGSVTLVFVGSVDGNLYCFNASGGPPVWTESLGGPIFTSPMVVNIDSTNTTVLCASHSGVLAGYVVNPTNPLAIPASSWTTTISNSYLFASPACDAAHGMVYEPASLLMSKTNRRPNNFYRRDAEKTAIKPTCFGKHFQVNAGGFSKP